MPDYEPASSARMSGNAASVAASPAAMISSERLKPLSSVTLAGSTGRMSKSGGDCSRRHDVCEASMIIST